MSEYETTLSGAAYSLRRVFWFLWRWRTLAPEVEVSGLALGRRSAMRAARTKLRSLKPVPVSTERPAAQPVVAAPAAPVLSKAVSGARSALYTGDLKQNGARAKPPGEREASFAPRQEHSPQQHRH